MRLVSHIKNLGLWFFLSFLLFTSPLRSIQSEDEYSDGDELTHLIKKQESTDGVLQMESKVTSLENPALPREMWYHISAEIHSDGCNLYCVPTDEEVDADHTPALKKANDNVYYLFVRRKNGSVSISLDPLTLGIDIARLTDIWNNKDASGTVFLRHEDEIMEAILLGGHTYVYNPLHLVSKTLNQYFQWRTPYSEFSKYPSVRNILNFLKVIEDCERKYLEFEGWGLRRSYTPDYRMMVKELTNSELLVHYSPVFRLNDGSNRLEAIRNIHDLKPPSNSSSLTRQICSSFARDPLLVSAGTVATAILTAVVAYHLYTISYLYHNQFVHDFSIALNTTTSEGFPQSLMKNISNSGRIDLNTTRLFDCYEVCKGWTGNDRHQMIIFPWHLCEHPNFTSPEFIDLVRNVTTLIQRGCGQKASELWSSWLNSSLGSFMNIMYNTSKIHMMPRGLLEKVPYKNLFMREDRFWCGYFDNDTNGPQCGMELSLYSYDPICIAQRMSAPSPIEGRIAGWSFLMAVIYGVFFTIMGVGLSL
jgi:hypothetical protein